MLFQHPFFLRRTPRKGEGANLLRHPSLPLGPALREHVARARSRGVLNDVCGGNPRGSCSHCFWPPLPPPQTIVLRVWGVGGEGGLNHPPFLTLPPLRSGSQGTCRPYRSQGGRVRQVVVVAMGLSPLSFSGQLLPPFFIGSFLSWGGFNPYPRVYYGL